MFSWFTRTRLYRTLSGYDIFISYSRADSTDYAYAICQSFIAKGYECYLDQLSHVGPGKALPPVIRKAIKGSTAFILIGSEGACGSTAIAEEIDLFLSHNKNKPLIPVSIGNNMPNAQWYEHVAGLATITDTSENLGAGKPFEEVLARIEAALKFTKKGTRLRRTARGIIVGVIALIVTAFFVTRELIQAAEDKVEDARQSELFAKKQTKYALKRTKKALTDQSAAKKETLIAQQDKRNADSLKAIAESKTVEANKELLKTQKLQRFTEMQRIAARKQATADSMAGVSMALAGTNPVEAFLIAKKADSITRTESTSNALWKAYESGPLCYKSLPCKYARIFPNKRYIALVDPNHRLSVIDWEGKHIPIVSGISVPDSRNWSISSDNASIVINNGSENAPSKIINLFNGTSQELKPEPGWAVLCVDRNTKRLATWTIDTIRVFSLPERTLISELATHEMKLQQAIDSKVQFDYSGDILVIQNTHQVQFVDIVKKEIIYTEKNDSIKDFKLSDNYPAEHSEDSSKIRMYSYNSHGKTYTRYWIDGLDNMTEGLLNRPKEGNYDRSYTFMEFSRDDEFLLALSKEGGAVIYNTREPNKPPIELATARTINIGGFSRHKNELITADYRNIATIWRDSGFGYKPRYELKGHKGPLSCVELSDDRRYALTVSYDGTLKLWNIESVPDIAEDNYKDVVYNAKTGHYEIKQASDQPAFDTGTTPDKLIEWGNERLRLL